MTSKENRRARYARFRQSPKGRATVAWHHIRARCDNSERGQRCYAHVEVRFTRAEFMAWAVPAFAAWLADNPVPTGDRKNGPSVDRIETWGHYEIGNLRIVSGGENRKRAVRKYAPAGKNAVAPEGAQWCSRCQQYKTFEEFPRDGQVASGRSYECRACHELAASGGATLRGRKPYVKKGYPAKKGPNAVSPAGTKWCPRCESYRLIAEFCRCPSQRSGLSAYCKPCAVAYRKQWHNSRKPPKKGKK